MNNQFKKEADMKSIPTTFTYKGYPSYGEYTVATYDNKEGSGSSSLSYNTDTVSASATQTGSTYGISQTLHSWFEIPINQVKPFCYGGSVSRTGRDVTASSYLSLCNSKSNCLNLLSLSPKSNSGSWSDSKCIINIQFQMLDGTQYLVINDGIVRWVNANSLNPNNLYLYGYASSDIYSWLTASSSIYVKSLEPYTPPTDCNSRALIFLNKVSEWKSSNRNLAKKTEMLSAGQAWASGC